MLYRVQSTALGQSGTSLRLLPGASVSVLDKNGAIADIFSDEAGTVPIANPMTASASGGYDFYVPIDGFYDVQITFGGNTISERIYPFWPITEAQYNAAIAAGAAAEAALATITAYGEAFMGTFTITAPSGGRGPYAIDVNPVNPGFIQLTVNGVYLSPVATSPHFSIVAVVGSPSGVGVLFADDQPVGARVDYTVTMPLGYNPVLDNSLDYPSIAALNAAIAGGMTRLAGRVVTAGGLAFVSVPGSVMAGQPMGYQPALRHKYDGVAANNYAAAATRLLATYADKQVQRITLTAGAGPFAVTFDLDTAGLTNADDGAYFVFYINLPSLADRRLIFRSGSGGSVLATMFTATSARYRAEFVFNGGGLVWQALGISQSLFI